MITFYMKDQEISKISDIKSYGVSVDPSLPIKIVKSKIVFMASSLFVVEVIFDCKVIVN